MEQMVLPACIGSAFGQLRESCFLFFYGRFAGSIESIGGACA